MNSNDTMRNASLPNTGLGTVGHVEAGAVVDQLNSFLRGEVSAVETYRQAIEKLQSVKDQRGVVLLNQLMASHQTRVTQLRDEVVRLGGTPAEGSGIWGAFAKMVEGAAELFGEKPAIAALEEGEDHGLKDYREGLEKLDMTTRQWIESVIYPEQKKTHNALRDFKKQLAAS